jgi:M6 family metalloprotease-like protein
VRRVHVAFAAVVAVAATLAVASHPVGTLAARVTDAATCDAPTLGLGVGEGRNDSDQMPPWVGELRIAMLFVEFPDAAGTSAPKDIHKGYVPAVVDWYRTVSYGRLRIEVAPVFRWLELPHPSSYYAAGRFDEVARDAVGLADPQADFFGVDALYLVPARSAALGPLGVGIYGRPIGIDGADIRGEAWLMTDGDAVGNVPYAVHETGHLLGLPDLYVTGSRSSFHLWDTMATGGTAPAIGGMFAWHRWKLEWLDAGQVACLGGRGSRTATITPLERAGGVKALVVRRGDAAYVAEVRQPLAEDAGICRGGVLLSAVDLSRPAKRWALRLLAPRPDNPRRWARCGPRWNATLRPGPKEVSTLRVGPVRFRVLAAEPDGSYRVRATVTP